MKATEPDRVQYAYCEYADAPLSFKQEPPNWLHDAIRDGLVIPEFRTEDYWYLVVENGRTEKRMLRPATG